MEQKKVRFAVVGAGNFGGSHMRAIKANADIAELVAICDINEEKVKALSIEYGVPYFLDYKEIPEKTDAEAVILNLPHGIHRESTVFFLESGLHVLLEKPMANTVAECDEMIEAERRSGKKLAIGHIQRFLKANRLAKEYIKSGKIGTLCMINDIRSINYFKPERPRWFLSKKLAGGGIVMNYGAHSLDKFAYVTEESVEEITAVCGNIKNDEDIEGHAQIFIKMSGGVTAAVTFSGYCPVGFETTYIGTTGAVKVMGVGRISVNLDGKWEEIPDVYDGLPILFELTEFAKMIRGEENEMPDSAYGRAVIKSIEEIYGKGL